MILNENQNRANEIQIRISDDKTPEQIIKKGHFEKLPS